MLIPQELQLSHDNRVLQHKGIPASVNDSRKCKINNDKVYIQYYGLIS